VILEACAMNRIDDFGEFQLKILNFPFR